jgi:hypothetical protein
MATASRAALAQVADDTVFLKSGGRIRGTVMVEDPSSGVRVKLSDGTVREVPAADVARVEYASDAHSAAPPAAPAPALTAPGAAPVAPAAADATTEDDSGRRIAFELGGILGPAFGQTTGFRASAFAGLQVPLGERWLVGARVGTLAYFYSTSARTDGYSTSHGSEPSYYLVGQNAASGQLAGALLTGLVGYSLSPSLFVRAGAIAGFAGGTASADLCDKFSTSGAVYGFDATFGMTLGKRKNIELALSIDGLVLPTGSCSEIKDDQTSTSSRGETDINDDDMVLNPAVSASFAWR